MKEQIFIHVKRSQIGQASSKGRAISTWPDLLGAGAFEIFLLAIYSSRLLSNKNHKSLLVIFISPFSGTSLRLNVAS